MSIACDGVCLTLISVKNKLFEFYLSNETIKKSKFKNLKVDDQINLELPLKFGQDISGHICQGHVDTTAKISNISKQNKSLIFKFKINKNFIKDLVQKAPVKKALKFGGPALAVAGSVLDFRDTYKRSQAQGDTKRRSLGKGLSRVAGGLVGGALGATAGSAVAPGAGTYIGGYGGYVAGQAAGEKIFNTLTTSKGRKQIAKSFKNFRNRAMKPVGSG